MKNLIKAFTWKIFFIYLEYCKKNFINEIIMLKSYLKQDNVASRAQPQHNIILFDLDFNVKFLLLRLLQFLKKYYFAAHKKSLI